MATGSKATFHCALCNELAGSVELLPASHPEALSNNPTISIRDFIGIEREVISGDRGELQAALREADPAALYKVERLWAPFYCAECARVYCRRHWQIFPVYDENFYDCSYGYCPENHKRLIDD
ncbi:MAG: hypothetical protein DMG65_20185 [Candidatus Angelobacter sp. Gp1-AA117]|nr:MAG: hypothetical protein DMG65_20185 [Candidatus Angelobacter sp. Gp1-AA117]